MTSLLSISLCFLQAHTLGNAKKAIEEFWARLRAQIKSKSGREALNLKQGEQVAVEPIHREETAKEIARPASEASVSLAINSHFSFFERRARPRAQREYYRGKAAEVGQNMKNGACQNEGQRRDYATPYDSARPSKSPKSSSPI